MPYKSVLSSFRARSRRSSRTKRGSSRSFDSASPGSNASISSLAQEKPPESQPTGKALSSEAAIIFPSETCGAQTHPPTSYPVSKYPPPLYTPWNSIPTPIPPPFHLPLQSFILACSPVIFEPTTSRVVLIHDTTTGLWQLPRGRKDREESLSSCALREGMEESGYSAELLRYSGGTLQPIPEGGDPSGEHSEAFWIQAMKLVRWKNKKIPSYSMDGVDVAERLTSFMYLAFYFLAVMEPGQVARPKLVGSHERGYVTHLVAIDEAIERLCRGPGKGMKFVPPTQIDSKTAMTESELVSQSNQQWDAFVKGGLELGKLWHDHDATDEQHDKDVFVEDGSLRIDAKWAKEIDRGIRCQAGEEPLHGGLYPDPRDGADDGRVQAMVVREGWAVLKKEMKRRGTPVGVYVSREEVEDGVQRVGTLKT